jgi:hypothetical protein
LQREHVLSTATPFSLAFEHHRQNGVDAAVAAAAAFAVAAAAAVAAVAFAAAASAAMRLHSTACFGQWASWQSAVQ